ncbi:MAG: hypothetical protein QW607_04395, partial [Desulfurococcaceae archaeon]
MKEKLACVFVIIVVSIVMLSQFSLSQVDPLKPQSYSLETVQASTVFYQNNRVQYPPNAVIYNYSMISIYINVPNIITDRRTWVYLTFFDTYIYLYPWNQYVYDFRCTVYLNYYSSTQSYASIGCDTEMTSLIYEELYFTSLTPLNITITVIGYEVLLDLDPNFFFLREYLNVKIVIGTSVYRDINVTSEVHLSKTTTTLTETDPGFYVKERRVDIHFDAIGEGLWTSVISSWGYLVKYYVPSTTSTTTTGTTTTTTTTTTTETTTSTTTTTIPPPPPPDHPIWRGNYYEASPIIKMSINDAIANNLYIYKRRTDFAWDYIYIYHFLTMRSFIYLLDSNHTIYLLILTDESETFKHKMILYDSTNNTILLQYEFHSMDSFIIKTINGELNYNFYRSKFGRSLIVKKERLVKLGNEFKLYPILSTVHYITVNTRTDKLNLKIYMPYRFNNSRI